MIGDLWSLGQPLGFGLAFVKTERYTHYTHRQRFIKIHRETIQTRKDIRQEGLGSGSFNAVP